MPHTVSSMESPRLTQREINHLSLSALLETNMAPREPLFHILSFLDCKDLNNFSQTSKVAHFNIQQLLPYLAKKGTADIQYQAGLQALNAWHKGAKEQHRQGAVKWLTQAAEQEHARATELLRGEGIRQESAGDDSKELTAIEPTLDDFTGGGGADLPLAGSQTGIQPLGEEIIRLTNAQRDVRRQVLFELAPLIPCDLSDGAKYSYILKDAWNKLNQFQDPEALVEEKKLKREVKRHPNSIPVAPEAFSLLTQTLTDITYQIKLLKELRSTNQIHASLVSSFMEAYDDLKSYYEAYLERIIQAANDATTDKGTECLYELLEYKVTALSEAFPHPFYRISQHMALDLLDMREIGFYRGELKGGQSHRVAPLYSRDPAIMEALSWMQTNSLYFKQTGLNVLRPDREIMIYHLYSLLNISLPRTSIVVLDNVRLPLGKLGDPKFFIQGSNTSPFLTQASWGVEGVEAEAIFKHQDPRLKHLDREAYAKQVLGVLLTCPNDGKSNNFIFSLLSNNPDPSYTLTSIDNDEILGNPLKREDNGKASVHLKSLLLAMPEMEESLSISMRDYFRDLNPQVLLLKWLDRLRQQNFLYDALKKHLAYLRPEEVVDLNSELSLPVRFSYSILSILQDRIKIIQQQLNRKEDSSLSDLLKALYPSVGQYYEEKRRTFNDPYKVIAAVYNGVVEDETRQFNEITGDQEPCNLILNPSEEELPLLTLQDEQPLTMDQAIKKLIFETNLSDYSLPLEQLKFIEQVTEIGIWPEKLHPSWYKSEMLINIVEAGASDKVIRAFVEKTQVDMNYKHKDKGTALHTAVRNGNLPNALSQITVLKELGADIEAQDDMFTPLDLAAEKKFVDVFEHLITLGAGKKAIPEKIRRFNQNINSEQRQRLSKSIKRLTEINPKAGWKISLDNIFPESSQGAMATITEGRRSVSKDVWGKLFNEDGTPKRAENQRGTRAVPYVEAYGQRIYVKFFPQLPGTELAVVRLAQQLLDYWIPECQLASINGMPVLLTQGVPGDTLFDVVHKHPKRLKKLDPESVSKALVLTMLINPGDGNLANYIVSPFTNKEGKKSYRLILIDNDQSFMPALAREIKLGWGRVKWSLQVKSVLYCLNQMTEDKVHQEVIDKIKGQDLTDVLEYWLRNLIIHHHAAIYPFDSDQVKIFERHRQTLVGIAFAPGMIRELFTKLMRLQKNLNEENIPFHVTLLEILEPEVLRRYKEVMEVPHLSLVKKFMKAENITDEKGLTSSSIPLPELAEARGFPDKEKLKDVLWSKAYGPEQALKELMEVKEQHISIQQIINDLGQPKGRNLKNLAEITLEDWLARSELTSLTRPQQEALFEQIKGKDLQYIILRKSAALTHSFLMSFKLNKVKEMDLSGCKNLEEIVLRRFMGKGPVSMPILTRLMLNDSGLQELRLIAPSLIKLEAYNCPNLKVLDLTTPGLKSLDLRGAQSLSKTVIEGLFKKFPTAFLKLNSNQFISDHELDLLQVKHAANQEDNLAELTEAAVQGDAEAWYVIKEMYLDGRVILPGQRVLYEKPRERYAPTIISDILNPTEEIAINVVLLGFYNAPRHRLMADLTGNNSCLHRSSLPLMGINPHSVTFKYRSKNFTVYFFELEEHGYNDRVVHGYFLREATVAIFDYPGRLDNTRASIVKGYYRALDNYNLMPSNRLFLNIGGLAREHDAWSPGRILMTTPELREEYKECGFLEYSPDVKDRYSNLLSWICERYVQTKIIEGLQKALNGELPQLSKGKERGAPPTLKSK
ncbi:MAG: hypothetical protein K0M45_01445 [Candidatus Paracaedibacteraceae bacterium]|nr:hypothetical protein [Candidatus Paracaedibacteraceae bacterium]